MASLSDILTTVQQGVTALNNFGAQIKGSFTNIAAQIAALSAAVAGSVTSVTGGTAITITGTPTAPIVNNAGVTSVTAGTGITITGTAAVPIVSNSGAAAANADNFLPNVNWQLWSALGYTGKQQSSGAASYPALNFTDPGAATSSPTLTAVTTTSPLAVGDIVIISKAGLYNYWGYPGTGYISGTTAGGLTGARITAVTGTTIALQAPLGGLAVSPTVAATWAVQGIGIGTSGTNQGPDGWALTATLQVWADDFATNFCPGAIRVLGIKKGITGTEDVNWQCAPNQLRRFQGQTVTFGAKVWQKVQGGAGTWQLFINDGVNPPYFSVAGTGSATGYQFVSVSGAISSLCTTLTIGIQTEGNINDILYMALPTGVIGASLTADGCKQNAYDTISATAHWNPPLLLGYQFNFPGVLALGLYSINNIDMEAISLCQCHKSVCGAFCKAEFTVAATGAYPNNKNLFSGNNVNVGGSGVTTQSLKFGPQVVPQVNGFPNSGSGILPLWYDGTFALFTNVATVVPVANTWDFWDVIGSSPNSLN